MTGNPELDRFLEAQGVRLDEEGRPTYYDAFEGTTRRLNQEELARFTQNYETVTSAKDSQGRPRYGTDVYTGLNSKFGNTPSYDPVTIDGVEWMRGNTYEGDTSLPEWKQVYDQQGVTANDFMYDPTYGALMKSDAVAKTAKPLSQLLSPDDFFDNPINLMGIMAGMAGGASFLAGGGLGAPATIGHELTHAAGFNGAAGAGAAGVDATWGANARPDMNFMDNFTDPFDPGTNPLDQFEQFRSAGGSPFDQFINPEYVMPSNIPYASGLGPSSGLFEIASNAGSNGLLSSLAQKFGEQAAKSTIGRLLSGQAGADDYAKLLGSVGSAGLGMLGAKTQSDAFKEVYDKQMALGAPSRARLEASYQPGFSMANEPGFKDAMDVSSKGILAGMSAKVGNPYDNPGSVIESQKQLMGNFALPQLNIYRSQNATSGQLGTNIAGTASLGQAQNAGNGLNSLGYGLGQMTSDDGDISQLLKKYGGMLGNGMNLNLGSSF